PVSGGRRCARPRSLPLLRLLCSGSGRPLSLRPLPLSAFHLLPPPIEPGLECPSPFRGILPREELRLVDSGDRFGAVLLLRPADDRRVERVACDEVRVVSLELSSWQVGSDPLVDQVRQVGRDV